MEQFFTSGFKLGIVAGGQLGKMLVQAASKWDVQTYVMDPNENCPAAKICTQYIKGNYKDFEDLLRFGEMVDLLTLEIEHVNLEAMKELEKKGKILRPSSAALKIIQDKGLQKQFYEKHNIPTAPFSLHENETEIRKEVEAGNITIPFVQKTRKAGYDGRGVKAVNDQGDLDDLLEGPSLVEQAVDIDKEIAVIVARNPKGDTKCFPSVEMEFNATANLVEQLVCPSSINAMVEEKAIKLATEIVEHLELEGILAVEMFLDKNGELLINEVAPRPHNSGHHTIESNTTSQYEQHLRAIFDFSLGSTNIISPAVMINLLGEDGHKGKVKYEGIEQSMAIEGVNIHIYGKRETRPFRKMGHVTIVDSELNSAKSKAQTVKKQLKVKAWNNQK